MKKHIFIFVVIIIAFLFFQHRSTPNIPTPLNYTTVGSNMLVTASLALPNASGEAWSLTQRSDKTYIINVYNNGKLIHSFYSGKLLKSDSTGLTYGTGGSLMFDRTPYNALNIHINNTGKTAYITFTPANKQSSVTNSSS